MIDPKYAGLPGIALDQPDVYETDDTNEGELSQDLPQDDTDTIEKIHVTASDAYKKFKDKHVSTKGIDFSDALSKKNRTGYIVHDGTWEYSSDDETLPQKYKRLKREIQEVLEEMNKMKDNVKVKGESESLTDIMRQLEASGKELDAMDLEKLLSATSIGSFPNQEVYIKELQSQIEMFKQKSSIESTVALKESIPSAQPGKSGILKYQMIYAPEKAKVQDVARISHLEKRLGILESVIGTPDENALKSSQILKSKGIVRSVEKLMASASLLNSAQLDSLEKKVSSLIHKMDSIIQKKTLAGQDLKYEETVSELYQLMKNSENCFQVLPQTIDRMLFLSSLHQRAAEFANQLKDLENLQKNIDGTLTNNKSLLEEIKKNFGTNLDTIANNLTALNDRVKKLDKK